MTQPFLGEIQLFGFNFAPYNWAACNGATLSIRQSTALFSLIGTTYGGDGVSTFMLPNLAGRAACSQGQAPGLSQRTAGEPFGATTASLTTNQIPSHTHAFVVYNQPDTTKRSNTPALNSALILPLQADPFPVQGTAPNSTFAPAMLGASGNNLPHENRQPALAINYCIAMSGVFPTFG
jgi:microcystin-dependent protein